MELLNIFSSILKILSLRLLVKSLHSWNFGWALPYLNEKVKPWKERILSYKTNNIRIYIPDQRKIGTGGGKESLTLILLDDTRERFGQSLVVQIGSFCSSCYQVFMSQSHLWCNEIFYIEIVLTPSRFQLPTHEVGFQMLN